MQTYEATDSLSKLTLCTNTIGCVHSRTNYNIRESEEETDVPRGAMKNDTTDESPYATMFDNNEYRLSAPTQHGEETLTFDDDGFNFVSCSSTAIAVGSGVVPEMNCAI